MKKFVETQVKNAIRKSIEVDGLKNTIELAFNDFDYDLEDIFSPKIKDPLDDSEYDRLLEKCENMARAVFIEIRRQLRQAFAMIESAVQGAALSL